MKLREERLYRIYVTDSLKAISENTTHFLGMNDIVEYGSFISVRWIDLLEPQEIVEDDRSCEEIVHDIWNSIRNGR